MVVCPKCANKRCPHADWHGNTCTGSNEAEQPGSRFAAIPLNPSDGRDRVTLSSAGMKAVERQSVDAAAALLSFILGGQRPSAFVGRTMNREQRERIRKEAEAIKANRVHVSTVPPPQQAIQRPPKPPVVKPGKPPIVGTEDVTAACGHVVPFEIFPDKQDKFRDARRQKLAGKACRVCRDKATAEREAAQKRERDEKIARGEIKPGKPQRISSMRLPAGSVKTLTWNGEEWRGVLTVPDAGEFWYVASSEKGCFYGLHDEYVKFLADGTKSVGTVLKAGAESEKMADVPPMSLASAVAKS